MKLLVYGSHEFAEVLADQARASGHEVAGFVDDFRCAPHVVGTFEQARARFSPRDVGFVLAIGYRHLQARWRIQQQLITLGYSLPPLVHPRAIVSPLARVGAGSVIMEAAVVSVAASVGEACVLWPGATLSHHSSLGCNVFLSPGAIVCGVAQVGSHTFIGAGAVIVDHQEVPEGAFVKAGSVFS